MIKTRLLIAAVGAVCAAAGGALENRPNGIFWPEFETAFAAAFKDYQAGQDPKVEMRGPSEITSGGYGQWIFEFTAGSTGMQAGQGVAIAFRHAEGWGISQSFDAGAPNYVTANSSGDISFELRPLNEFSIFNRYFYEYFPWQHLTSVIITRGQLLPGQSIRLVFGELSKGSPGYRAPSVARENALFLALFRRKAAGQFIPIPERLSVCILGKRATRLNIIVPSDTDVGSPFRIIVRAEDDQGNLATGYCGTVALRLNRGTSTLPPVHTFKPSDRGVHIFPEVRFLSSGLYRIQASDPLVGISTESNPSRCSDTRRSPQVFWGDFHSHSVVSDGTGSPTENFTYARDVAGLDFFALTDHCYQMDEVRWAQNQRVATKFNRPPQFTTFYGYEWSGETDVGGDHNVIYLQPDLPLYRSNSYHEPKNPFIYSGTDLDAPHIVQLYKRFKLLAADKKSRVLVVPHFRGRTANPLWNNLEFSPLIEVASEAGWHETWALEFLRNGHRLGFVGSCDDHLGRPGYGIADQPEVGYGDSRGDRETSRDRFSYPWGDGVVGSPLMAVLAPENSRESLFDALFARHCYATSGARILLDFTANGHLMGDEFSTSSPPSFEAVVEAQTRLASVILKKDGEALYTQGLQEPTQGTRLTHTDAVNYKGHFYYIEATTEDGQRAVSSPIWID